MLESIKGKDGEETDCKLSMYVSQRDHLWGGGAGYWNSVDYFLLFTRSPFFQLQVTNLLITLFIVYFTLYILYIVLILLFSLLKFTLAHLRERVSVIHDVTLCLSSLLL